MNDHRRSRLKQLASGLALVSASALADDAPKPEAREVNSPNPAYEKPAPTKVPLPKKPLNINSPPPRPPTLNSPPPAPTKPEAGPEVQLNSPPEVAPRPPPPSPDAGVLDRAPQPPRINSPGARRPK